MAPVNQTELPAESMIWFPDVVNQSSLEGTVAGSTPHAKSPPPLDELLDDELELLEDELLDDELLLDELLDEELELLEDELLDDELLLDELLDEELELLLDDELEPPSQTAPVTVGT